MSEGPKFNRWLATARYVRWYARGLVGPDPRDDRWFWRGFWLHWTYKPE